MYSMSYVIRKTYIFVTLLILVVLYGLLVFFQPFDNTNDGLACFDSVKRDKSEEGYFVNSVCTCLGVPRTIDEAQVDGSKYQGCYGVRISSCVLTENQPLFYGGNIITKDCVW